METLLLVPQVMNRKWSTDNPVLYIKLLTLLQMCLTTALEELDMAECLMA